MAKLVLGAVGSVFGPIGSFIGSTIGGIIDNQLFPTKGPRLSEVRVGSASYGESIPLIYGAENRLGLKLIWQSELREKKHKKLKGPTTFTYSRDYAFVVGAGPLLDAPKLWANGKVIFDASAAVTPPTSANGGLVYGLGGKSHEFFESITFYPGSATQLPDPTIEAAKGVGNVPAYRHTAYIVIKGLQLDEFNRQLPQMQTLARRALVDPLQSVVIDICVRCGLDPNTISTSLLTGVVRGYIIGGQATGSAALSPLGLVHNFDAAEVAGGLRFQPRGSAPLVTIRKEDLAGHVGAALPGTDSNAYELSRQPETNLPKGASVTFFDPARDYQENTQGDTRTHGYAQNVVSQSVPITMTVEEAKRLADRLLWEANIAREGFRATSDDRLLWLEPGRVYALEGPAGNEPVRLVRRTRGANRVIDFDAERDRRVVYSSISTGQGAPVVPNDLTLSGPANPPIIFEVPPELANGVPQLALAISGGDGTTANPNWLGCSIYVSTDDTAFYPIGQVVAPAIMGELTAILAAYPGANPDTGNTLAVTTEISGGAPEGVTSADAARFLSLVYADGEFLSYRDSTETYTDAFDLDGELYRGLYRTTPGAHAAGSDFVRFDDAVFRYDLPAAYVGVPLFFRLVGVGETIDGVPSYGFTPTGSQAAAGPPTNVAQAATGAAITVTWDASPGPYVGGYEIEFTTDGGATYQPAGTAGPTATSFEYLNTIPLTTYEFRVRTLNGAPMVSPSAYVDAAAGTTTGGQGSRVWAPTISLFGRKPDVNEVLFQTPATFATKLPAGLVGSSGRCDVAPTVDRTFSLQKNGVQVGTVLFPAGLSGDDVAVFTMAAGQTFTPPNDDVQLLAPSTTDSTFEGFSIQFLGSID